MSEIVEELRALDDETMCFDGPATYALIKRAADRIEKLDAEVTRLQVNEEAHGLAVYELTNSLTAAEERAEKAEAEAKIAESERDEYIRQAKSALADIQQAVHDRGEFWEKAVNEQARATAAEAENVRLREAVREAHALLVWTHQGEICVDEIPERGWWHICDLHPSVFDNLNSGEQSLWRALLQLNDAHTHPTEKEQDDG